MRQLLIAIALVACSSNTRFESKLPPQQPQCDFVNYHHDESTNIQGPSRCSTDCDCDGVRSCTNGSCTGAARPTPGDLSACTRSDYRWNEAWNGGGDGVCANDCECNGTRRCTAGRCSEGAHKDGDSTFTR